MSWATPPRDTIEPVDTIVVTGGPDLAAVDASEVRRAAARMAAVGETLREACRLAGSAWAQIVAPPVAIGTTAARQTLAGPDATATRTAAADAVQTVTADLRSRADGFETLGRRLLRTAGLYEEAESTTERVIGALVTAEGYVLGRLLGVVPVPQALGAAYRVSGRSIPERATGPGDGHHPEPAHEATSDHRTTGEVGGATLRHVTPWTDEFVLGLGLGLARTTDAGHAVPGAAGQLADAVRGAPLGTIGTGVRIERVPGHALPTDRPGRRDGTRPIEEALRWTDDLYPRNGVPHATVAVRRITGQDQKPSWLVAIPGTQSATPATHPWDGLTDLELLAGHPDQASEAIQAAMTDAGVGPDEPVVLVGHSLGGMAATALAASPSFARRFRIGGVVTAGSPVAGFRTPPGVPVLHLEAAEGVVANLDGRPPAANPRTVDRVTVSRVLADSPAPVDRAASGDVARAHDVTTHVRTLALARESGDPRPAAVVDRIEPLLRGDRVETRLYRAERTVSPSAATGPAGSP